MPLRVIGGRCQREDTRLSIDLQAVVEIRLRRARGEQPCSLHVDMDGGHSSFNAVLRVGERARLQSTIKTCGGRRTYTFDLPDAGRDEESTVWLVKKTEPTLSQILPPLKWFPPTVTTTPATIYALSCPGCKLLEPAVAGPRRIEFVGDSDLAAFGIEGKPTTLSMFNFVCAPHCALQDISNSWAHMLCRMLGAEPSVVAWSGIGVAQCAVNCDVPVLKDAEAEATGPMERVYLRALASDPSSVHDFDGCAWQPQLVVVCVGGNDLYGGRRPPSREGFCGAYASLLRCIRARRPASVIVCLVYCLDTPEYHKMGAADGKLLEYTEEAVRRFRDQAGGEHKVFVTALEGAGLSWPDDGGTLEHWGKSGHRKWADALCAYIEGSLAGEEGLLPGWGRQTSGEQATSLS